MSKPTELSKEELQAFQKVASNDLVDFSIYTDRNYNPTWLHEEIAKQLTRVEKGEVKRLMIFVPPRHGKSELGSIKFPAWYLGRHPEKEVITSSYSAELAQDFGYKTRNLVATQEYQQIFNTKLRDDSKSKAKWLTGEGGGYTATGVGGAITGRGADLAIIDDPFKNREEAESKTIRDKVYNWYTSTLYTRLEKGGAIILILTRWHQDDLAGRLLKAMEEGGEQWEVIKFPALATQDEAHRKQGEPLWTDKYDLNALENIKKTIGVYDWCSPKETPILMEDWTTKPILEVKAGDIIVGFERGTKEKRARLVRSKVLKTASRIDNVCDIELESGRKVRCTDKHRWYTKRKEGSDGGRKEYAPARVGGRLMFVEEPYELEISNEEKVLWGYLAGIIDGEGHIARSAIWISQTVGKNQPVIDKIREVLDKLGIDYNEKFEKSKVKGWNDKVTFITRNPREVYRKLLRYTDIAKKQQIVDRMYDCCHMFIRKEDKVFSIEKGKKETVYSLQTETGNYIAWGYASSNSALYQQTPTNSETQEFKQEFWQYRTMEEVLALTTYRTLTIDTAISQKASADYTGLCVNFTDRENKWNLKSWKEKISPLELIDLLFNLQEQYRFDSIGIEKTIYLQAIKPFLDEEMRRRNRFLPIVELQHNGVQKEIRIRALLPRYESKSIYHITGQCTDLEEDQLSFPKGIHDDVLDATAYQTQIAQIPEHYNGQLKSNYL